VDWPCVSPDGRYLLFSWSASRADKADLDIHKDFDLYRLEPSEVQAVPEPLDVSDINRPRAGAVKKRAFFHDETMPVMAADGSQYFWTERCNGVGERDIYVAPIGANGRWAIARPLSAPINAAGRDTYGWISAEQDLMLLSYPERGGEGDEDLFLARKRNGAWQTPVAPGAEVNSRYADFAPKLSADRNTLLFSSTRPFAGQAAGLIQVWAMPIASIPALAEALRGLDTPLPDPANQDDAVSLGR